MFGMSRPSEFSAVRNSASPPSVGARETFRFACETDPSDETVVHVAEYPTPVRDLCQLASGANNRFSTRFHQGWAGCAAKVARNSCVGGVAGNLVDIGDST